MKQDHNKSDRSGRNKLQMEGKKVGLLLLAVAMVVVATSTSSSFVSCVKVDHQLGFDDGYGVTKSVRTPLANILVPSTLRSGCYEQCAPIVLEFCKWNKERHSSQKNVEERESAGDVIKLWIESDWAILNLYGLQS
ncbi:hypothetical protein FNV43_RR03479 [Rhamnella rubrinervis]|uniref:Uncharacterized protein n=1 Tax=Rhamnella rubrinervis TaxID=2594499 RepID=A0A8K0HHT0_9ROSA|nr:hypothetical protein FNV43_RR03479 [Rhamnella rubrinervis]